MKTRSRLALVAATFHAWPAECVILSPDGTILAVNDAWRQFGEDNGAGARCGPGTNYLTVTQAAVISGDDTAEVALNSLEAVLSGNAPLARLDYPCHSPNQQRWFRLHAATLPDRREVLVVHDNISDLVLGESRPASDPPLRGRPGDGASGQRDLRPGLGLSEQPDVPARPRSSTVVTQSGWPAGY